MDSNLEGESPSTVVDISAAMPPLCPQPLLEPLVSTNSPGNSSNSAPTSGNLSVQQHQPQDIIMNPAPNRIKRFVFRSGKKSLPAVGSTDDITLSRFQQGSASVAESGTSDFDILEVIVPERIQASYGLYVWPCAPILAWYLFENRQYLPGKRILELGAGTALPGVTASLCGAQVTLTDSAKLTHCLDQCRRTADVNGVGDRVKVLGLTWGLFLNNLTRLKGQVDILIGSDCFYDPTVFEDLISTVAYILEHNPQAKFLSTYQERSADWSIEHLLKKWGLHCKHIPLSGLANANEIDLLALMQDHTIHLLEITLKPQATSSTIIPTEETQEDIEFSSNSVQNNY